MSPPRRQTWACRVAPSSRSAFSSGVRGAECKCFFQLLERAKMKLWEYCLTASAAGGAWRRFSLRSTFEMVATNLREETQAPLVRLRRLAELGQQGLSASDVARELRRSKAQDDDVFLTERELKILIARVTTAEVVIVNLAFDVSHVGGDYTLVTEAAFLSDVEIGHDADFRQLRLFVAEAEGVCSWEELLGHRPIVLHVGGTAV
ncbi:unnamed protein product [Symbiodinium natans]|uniref:Uncharacterized protein n=1 Tax=Symbiodinium natans TaxID=878477 RepID=A0A812MQY9_9DINO|nr:unnamed protein product [Symbiodinium natans]